MSASKTILVGNVCADPDIRHTNDGTPIANFNLATSETYKNKQGEKVTDTEFHKISIYGKLAEIVEKYVKKGQLLYLEGQNKTQKWQDKEGKDRWTTYVRCKEMRMLGGKKDSVQAETTPAQNQDNTHKPYDDSLPF